VAGAAPRVAVLHAAAVVVAGVKLRLYRVQLTYWGSSPRAQQAFGWSHSGLADMIGYFGEGPCGDWVVTHLLLVVVLFHRAGLLLLLGPLLLLLGSR